MQVFNSDGSSLDGKVFSYDKVANEFTIDTKDVANVGTYHMKVVARFAGSSYSQADELEFTVTLIEECASAKVTNPGD